jgi:L-2,4-diaminobutyrate decarboxylase
VAALAAVAMEAVARGALLRNGPLPPGSPVLAGDLLPASDPVPARGSAAASDPAAIDGLAAAGGRRVNATPVWISGRASGPVLRSCEALPEVGVGAARALTSVLEPLARGSVDPAQAWCAGHLQCAPLAVAAAADLAAGVLNQSMDSWDQAPAASALEAAVTSALAELVYGGSGRPDAVITGGGTESNLLAVLLARELLPGVRVVCGENAHHSVARAAWVAGLAEPVVLPCRGGVVAVGELDAALRGLGAPALVVATAGTTDSGAIDPLRAIAAAAREHGARLHVDAAYGGGVLFSRAHAPLLDGVHLADSVAVDLHKLGWQPIPAGVLAVADREHLASLTTSAAYLNAADDLQAGLPDLLGRSLRTSRRADAVKIAVTFAALGRGGLGALVERCLATAAEVASRVAAHPGLELWAPPTLSTVLLRPRGASDPEVAALRRRLLHEGRAVLGRAELGGRRWLKLTLLNPHVGAGDYDELLDLVAAR